MIKFMSNATRRATARLPWFRRSEDGTAAAELVAVFPIFILVLGLGVDLTMTYMHMNRMWDVARDTARRVSVGDMTILEAETYAAGRLPASTGAIVDIKETDETDISVNISATGGNLTIFGYFLPFEQSTRVVEIVMRKEG
jgi:hypothetical protein